MTRTRSCSNSGLASSSDMTWTPAASWPKKSAKRLKAGSGAPVACAASSNRGARRVNSSRPCGVRVAGARPVCQARIRPETWAGWLKPMRASVSSVSGSSSTPVKTRLPKGLDRSSSCANRAA